MISESFENFSRMRGTLDRCLMIQLGTVTIEEKIFVIQISILFKAH